MTRRFWNLVHCGASYPHGPECHKQGVEAISAAAAAQLWRASSPALNIRQGESGMKLTAMTSRTARKRLVSRGTVSLVASPRSLVISSMMSNAAEMRSGRAARAGLPAGPAACQHLRHLRTDQPRAPATLARRGRAIGKVRWPLRPASVMARPAASRPLIRAHPLMDSEPLMTPEGTGEA